MALFSRESSHVDGGGRGLLSKKREGRKCSEGTRERDQTSIEETLFVCGFTDVSVDFEHSGLLALAVEVESSDESTSDSKGPKKDHEEGGACRKKRRKVGREEGYRVRRGGGASGACFSIVRNRGGGRRGGEGERSCWRR